MRTFAQIIEPLNHSHVARKLNTSRNRVNGWSHGKGYPTALELPVLSDILGISVDDLVRSIAAENAKAQPADLAGHVA